MNKVQQMENLKYKKNSTQMNYKYLVTFHLWY